MGLQQLYILLIPFLGTALGAAATFLTGSSFSRATTRALGGFAAGVMVAASFWSLLEPALDGASGLGSLAFVPVTLGFLGGGALMLALDTLTPHMHADSQEEGPRSGLSRTTKLVLAVTIHNIPEGMAVGVVAAGWALGSGGVTQAAALSLALGIALQNVPEGAIVSMPLRAEGRGRLSTFGVGVLSGAVEPAAALLAAAFTGAAAGVMPALLGFAAGAMLYVVVEELIPEASEGGHSNVGPVAFMLGFAVMMALDTALG